MYGTADNRLVITVAPQNDICPHGRTYPTKAVAIVMNISITPTLHVCVSLCMLGMLSMANKQQMLSLLRSHVIEASAAELHCCKFTPIPCIVL
jgi:hypothetical protein